MRIKFIEKKGQRRFLDLCVQRLSCGTVRRLLQFGIESNYSNLKNYYSERRLITEDLFLDLCRLCKFNFRSFEVEGLKFIKVEDNWGKVKGGTKSKRRKIKS